MVMRFISQKSWNYGSDLRRWAVLDFEIIQKSSQFVSCLINDSLLTRGGHMAVRKGLVQANIISQFLQRLNTAHRTSNAIRSEKISKK